MKTLQKLNTVNYGIVLSEIVTLIIALWQGWGFDSVLYAYLIQGIVVAFFDFLGIIFANDVAYTLPNHMTAGTGTSLKQQHRVVILFAGIRYAIYSFFLFGFGSSIVSIREGLLLVSPFFCTQLYHFLKTHKTNNTNVLNRIKNSDIEKRLTVFVIIIVIGGIFVGMLQLILQFVFELQANDIRMIIEKTAVIIFFPLRFGVDMYYSKQNSLK